MLSRIFLRYVDRFGCDYHRLSATDLQCLFIIIDSMGGNCQYEIFKGTAKQPRVQRVQLEKRFRKFKGFREFRGWWYRPSGDEQKVSVTGLAFESQMMHGEQPKPPSLGRRWRRRRRRIGASVAHIIRTYPQPYRAAPSTGRGWRRQAPEDRGVNA